MPDERTRLGEWVDRLLDPDCPPDDHARVTQEWFDAWAAIGGLPTDPAQSQDSGLACDSFLPSGKAISPLTAAQCIMDYPRTAAFLRAADAALVQLLATFRGQTVHVLEAGCGPFAPLAFALAARHDGAPVRFTLLDVHPESLAIARRIAAALKWPVGRISFVHGDVTSATFPADERPHLIVCELIQRALADEPQVAATLHLVPLLRPGGLFLPEKIEIRAGLFDAHAHYARTSAVETASVDSHASGVTDLGLVFELSAHALPHRDDDRLPARTLTVPRHHPIRSPLHLLTRIHIFGPHLLPEFACAITFPAKVDYPAKLAEEETSFPFHYALGAAPGFRLSLKANADR